MALLLVSTAAGVLDQGVRAGRIEQGPGVGGKYGTRCVVQTRSLADGEGRVPDNEPAVMEEGECDFARFFRGRPFFTLRGRPFFTLRIFHFARWGMMGDQVFGVSKIIRYCNRGAAEFAWYAQERGSLPPLVLSVLSCARTQVPTAATESFKEIHQYSGQMMDPQFSPILHAFASHLYLTALVRLYYFIVTSAEHLTFPRITSLDPSHFASHRPPR